jgi:hypothetical protein
MKTTLTQPQRNEAITSFIALFKDGVEAWIKAGEILVELVEDDPHAYDYIIQQCPQINAGILGRFEQMGRKTLHPQLLLTSSPGFARLQRLPFSLQERYITEPIPLIIHTDDGTDMMLVQAKNMTKEQAAQCFAPGRIRTEGEQKAWMMQQRSNAARPVNKDSAPAWTIKGGRVIFREGTSMSAGELATIIAQLTK